MPPGPLTFKEKAGFIGLLVFAILVVILGFKNFDNTIKAPFAKELAAAPVPGEPTDDQIKEELKHKDTDSDGLSDYDELYIYHTSPYLADSDSDGIPDGVEIKNGTDPNCPEGKICGLGSQAQPTPAPIQNTEPIAPASLGGLLNLLSANSDPKAIRQFLIQQGVDPKLLEKVSDQELVSLLRGEAAKAGQATSTAAPSLTPGTFNAAAWRQELVKQGLDPKVLEKLSDEELQKMVSETVKGSQ